MSEQTPRERFAKVLTDWGIDALTSDPPHGWRCEYPDSYGQGPCDCVNRLLDDLEAAAQARTEALDVEVLAEVRRRYALPDSWWTADGLSIIVPVEFARAILADQS